MIWSPFLGAVADAGSVISERKVLRNKKIDIKTFQVAVFLGVIILFLPIIYFFFSVKPEAFQLKNVLIFLGAIGLAVFWNLLLSYSMKGEKVGNLEPALVLQFLFTIILALIFSFFWGDIFTRNLNVIIPALIAGIALTLSHVKKYHLKFDKYFTAAIFASLFCAFEIIISNFILKYYNPITFYFLRCLGVLIFSAIFLRTNFKSVNYKIWMQIFLVSLFWIIFRVSVYYGYLNIGVALTTLIVMISPVFVYIFARIFLKERFNWKNIITSIVIVACVVYAIFA